VWLCWREEDERDLRPVLPCRAEDRPDDRGDAAPCTLFVDHAGGHSFSFDAGDLPDDCDGAIGPRVSVVYCPVSAKSR
jgi:hypothetical protein